MSMRYRLGLLAALVGGTLLASPCYAGTPPDPFCPEPAIVAPDATPELPATTEDPPTPIVALRVRVPATAEPGKELTYKICVENCSDAPAHHVLVRNPLPKGARFVSAKPEPATREPEIQWRLGTLKPAECRDIYLTLAPTGKEDILNCARVQFEHGECVRTRLMRPVLVLRKDGPAQGIVGQTLHYRLTVSNTGSAAARSVILTDRLAQGLEHASGHHVLSWQFETLAPGENKAVDYEAVARAPGRLCNEAVATAGGEQLTRSESCVTVGEAKLSLAKSGPADRRYLNENATFQITVSNTGTMPLSGVEVTDLVPAGTSVVSALGGQPNGNEVRWTLGELAAGASRTLEITLRGQTPGRVCNRVRATATGGVQARSEWCVEFVGASGLLLEVVDTDDPVEVGGETSYIINVRNQGQIPVTNLTILAEVPAQMAIVRVTGPADHAKDGQRLSFTPMTLAPRGEARYTVYVKALAPGDVRFRVDMAADQLPSGPVHEEESTQIYRDLPDRQGEPPLAPRPPEGVDR